MPNRSKGKKAAMNGRSPKKRLKLRRIGRQTGYLRLNDAAQGAALKPLTP